MYELNKLLSPQVPFVMGFHHINSNLTMTFKVTVHPIFNKIIQEKDGLQIKPIILKEDGINQLSLSVTLPVTTHKSQNGPN